MLRPTPVRLYAALLALAAMLLLATLPAVGRITASTTAQPHAAVDASRSGHHVPAGGQAHHRPTAAGTEEAPAPLHAAGDCIYCVLLGSLATPALPGTRFAVPRAPQAAAGRIHVAAAVLQPHSTLGSRGPPADAA